MAKLVLKLIVFFLIALAVGQIPIKGQVVGAHFVDGVKTNSLRLGETVMESSVMSRITRPKFLEKWFPLGQLQKLQIETPKKATEAVKETIEQLEEDRDAVMEILE